MTEEKDKKEGYRDVEAGILNNSEQPKTPKSYRDPKVSNFFRNTEETNSQKYDTNILESRGNFRGVVLRKEEKSSDDDGLLSGFLDYFGASGDEKPDLAKATCRIPLLHAACPVPSDHPDQEGAVINAFYHTFTSQSDLYKEENCPDAGEVVWLDYGDRENMSSPQFIKPVYESKQSPTMQEEKPDPKKAIKNPPPGEKKVIDKKRRKKPHTRTRGKKGIPVSELPSFIKTCTDEEFLRRPNVERCESTARAIASPPVADSFVFHDTAGFTFAAMVEGMGNKHVNLGKGAGVTFAITEGAPIQKQIDRISRRSRTLRTQILKKQKQEAINKIESEKKRRLIAGEDLTPAELEGYKNRIDQVASDPKFKLQASDPSTPGTSEVNYGGAEIYMMHDLMMRSSHAGLHNDKRGHGVEIVNIAYAGFEDKAREFGHTGEIIEAPWQVARGGGRLKGRHLSPSLEQMESGYRLILWLSELPPDQGGGLVLEWPVIHKNMFPYGTVIRQPFLPPERQHAPGVYAHGHLTDSRADGYIASSYCYFRHIKQYSKSQAYDAAKAMSAAATRKAPEGAKGSRVFWSPVL